MRQPVSRRLYLVESALQSQRDAGGWHLFFLGWHVVNSLQIQYCMHINAELYRDNSLRKESAAILAGAVNHACCMPKPVLMHAPQVNRPMLYCSQAGSLRTTLADVGNQSG